MKKIKIGHLKASIQSSRTIFISAIVLLMFAISGTLSQGVYAATCADGTTVPDPPTNIGAEDRKATLEAACSSHGGQKTNESQSSTPTTTVKEAFDKANAGLCTEDEDIQYNEDGTTDCVTNANAHYCGSGISGAKKVRVSFDFGCRGPAYGKALNPITDILFAIFRVASAGVGIIVIGSIIVAGIQYASSRGNPQQTENAIKRITSAIIALLIYIFMFAILNFLVPGGMFL